MILNHCLRDEQYSLPFNLWTGNAPWQSERNSSKMIIVNFWGGKKNLSQRILLEKVALAFDSSKWEKQGWVKFEKGNGEIIGSYEWQRVNLLPLRVAYPLGKCLKLDIPEDIEKSKINKIGIEIRKKAMNARGIENININFQDPNKNLVFIQPPFKINERIFKEGKESTYKLKTNVKIKLAEDPRTTCKDYEIFGQYEDCKEEEMRSIFQSQIGCVPIWFTDQPGHCGRKNISEEKVDIVYELLSSIEADSFKSKCLPPCTAVEYVATHKSTYVSPFGEEGIYIFLDQNVQVSRTSFVIDPFTLLNRLGGTIGICKEALWIILILVGVVESSVNIFKAYVFQEKT